MVSLQDGSHLTAKEVTGGSEEAAKYKKNNLNKPSISPFLFNFMLSAAGTLGSPGIVIIDPHTTTKNSAPLDNLTSNCQSMA